VATEAEAVSLVTVLRGAVGLFKVGLELFTSLGPRIIDCIAAEGGEVFLDTKFMDIPATVEGASRAAALLGVKMFNVHCFGGRRMMSAAAGAAAASAAAAGRGRPLVLGVTVLTSIDNATLKEDVNVLCGVADQVLHLARSAAAAGLDGVIASPQEVRVLRDALPTGMIVVTPGVRPSWAPCDDQRRIATPAEAVEAGADYVVVGRPITRPPGAIGGPLTAARLIADEIAQAQV
jgi:orotidine-5'-phosphate decarboxylase